MDNKQDYAAVADRATIHGKLIMSEEKTITDVASEEVAAMRLIIDALSDLEDVQIERVLHWLSDLIEKT